MTNAQLFVAQLDWSVTDAELGELFTQCGTVVNARIPMDKMSGRPRGFGFVEMSSPEEAQAAINTLNDWDYKGRKLVVKLSEPREERPARQGGGYGNRSGYGGGGGYGGRRY